MKKFRKKPVVIEAYQTNHEMDIPTLEGTMHADPGDWIITGVKGEQYPCKPDIFAKTYEPAEDDGEFSAIKPIVYCKDCIHWDAGSTEECNNIDNACFHNGWCRPKWFCADGKKKGTEE